MATAKIVKVGPDEYELIRDLHNAVARPARDADYFRLRLNHHPRVLLLVAELEGQPVGCSCGYELRPTTYYSWLYAVLPDARRMGVASQLLAAEHAWVRDHGYEMARLECYNQHRPMLHLAIKNGYDIVGIRWDSHTAANLVIFEKSMHAQDE